MTAEERGDQSAEGAARTARSFRGVRWGERSVAAAFDLVYPRACWICDERILWPPREGASRGGVLVGRRGTPLEALVCDRCRREASVPARIFCRRCGRVAIPETARGENAICRFCLRGKPTADGKKPGIDETRPLHFYRGTTRALVLQLKRTRDPILAEIAAALYFEARRRTLRAFRPDAVVPVPMNWRRRLLRSVNSPDFLAAELARLLGVPCWSRTVRRVRATPPQSSVDWDARRRNVAGAFALVGGAEGARAKLLKGKRILLVDDAFTSGATASEIADLLKDAGVVAVCVATLARAGLGKGRRI